MPIDLAAVDWLYVAVLAMLVFVSTLIGRLIAFRTSSSERCFRRCCSSVAFVFWTYYPHQPAAADPARPGRQAARATGATGSSRAGRAAQAAQPGHRHHAAATGASRSRLALRAADGVFSTSRAGGRSAYAFW